MNAYDFELYSLELDVWGEKRRAACSSVYIHDDQYWDYLIHVLYKAQMCTLILIKNSCYNFQLYKLVQKILLFCLFDGQSFFENSIPFLFRCKTFKFFMSCTNVNNPILFFSSVFPCQQRFGYGCEERFTISCDNEIHQNIPHCLARRHSSTTGN